MSAMRGAPPPPRIVVMGVSGCGKSTVGCLLAQALGVAYIEGDSLHPAQSVARMAAGIALTDTDRQGWLQAVARRLGDAPGGVVASCSALKRSYRDLLRDAAPGGSSVSSWLCNSEAGM
jgi:gluconokinase